MLSPQTLLLLLLAKVASTKHQQGLHTMLFFQTLLTWDGFVEYQYTYLGYVDDTLFMGYNSRTDKPRMKPHAPWMHQETPQFWEYETQRALNLTKQLTEELKAVLHIYNQSKTGYHTVQMIHGCTVLPGGYFGGGYYEVIYDGRDYIALNEDLSTWTAVGMAAKIIRYQWKILGTAELVKTYLENSCMYDLQKHLENGKEILLRTEPPQPSVSIMPIVAGLAVGAVLTGAVVTFLIRKRRNKGKERAGSEFVSLWE
ncbi:HLA class I histocompatibility antigen [Cricetulus griseus]|uniref:HLA class I histocompatibility antigen n=1 Tax=Cricetulus griseus TaxID=10029 RepID=A0A061IGZ8_CRIGR|nr:HLA class I histocompatibility antigen [Cricetulus griseus]